MSEPSNWPLSNKALRVKVPKHIEQTLAKHALSSNIYATSIGYYPSAEKHEMARKNHDDYILIYCSEGQGYLKTKLYDGPIGQGDLFILPPQTPHNYYSESSDPWTVFWFHFRGSEAHSYYEYLYNNATDTIIQTHDIQTLAGFRELIDSARSSFSLESHIYLSSLLSHLLITISRAITRRVTSGSGLDIDTIQAFMRQNIDKAVYLEDLARLSHVSKYHFSRQYHLLTGMTPLQHFSHIKIEHACSLLEQTKLSISDIAYQLGYDDALYFSRVFKKQMKLSPRAYRKSLIGRD